MNWHNPICERCNEKRPIEWSVSSDIIFMFVCDPCGQAALELKKGQTSNEPFGYIVVIPFNRNLPHAN